MAKKRLWIALVAIPISLASLLVVGAQKPHLSNAGGVIDPKCTSPLPCVEYDNNSGGPGVKGQSLFGNGVSGVTKINSTSSSNGESGIFGSDLSTSGKFDSGVNGVSVRGTGASGQSTSGVGLMGLSTGNNGVFGDSKAPGASGVYGQNDGGGFGVAGRLTKPGIAAVFADAGSTGSVALSVSSVNGIGANVVGGDSALGLPALNIVGNSNADLIDACGPSSGASNCLLVRPGCFTVGDGVGCSPGDVDIGGEYLKHGICVAGCSAATATRAGRAIVSYVATQSLPTIDDFGEATLQNGYAHVRIDAAFANVIDSSANYLVFITPEGDSRGLYVTQKTAQGFVVRENMGGHSSLAFSYRIVAKPLGKQEQRLPMVELPKPRSARHVGMTMPR